EEDEFDFVSTITRGGTVLPSGNANQFLVSVRDFSWETPVETVSSSATIKDPNVNATGSENVVMAFENDFTVELAVLPTLTILNGGSGAFGAVTAVLDEDGDDSVYTATYTPGAVEEKITFVIRNASAIAGGGFVMVNDTVENGITVDLTAPLLLGNNSSTSASGQTYNILLDENIGSVTLTEDFATVDDDEDGEIDGADTDGDAVKVSDVTWTDNVLDFKYDWKAADGAVTLSLEVKDAAGNVVVLPAGLSTVNLN
ncbi:MAG: hypothetical protein ABJP45_16810, partial [Cyclobacteriaceae bacterium]